MKIHNENIELKDIDEKQLEEYKKECMKLFPKKKYEMIYMDPPWKYKNIGNGLSNQCHEKYPTMGYEELKELPIKEISEKNCVLFIWSTSPKLPEALELIKAWNFEYKTIFKIWRKVSKKGEPVSVPGWWSRSNNELLLVAAKGSPLKLWKTKNNEPQEYSSIREEHSSKPIEIREQIRNFLKCKKRIEIFARTIDENYDAWGLEVPGFFYENSISKEIKNLKCRDIGIQCEITEKPKKSKDYLHKHKPECQCCICKKIRKREENKK